MLLTSVQGDPGIETVAGMMRGRESVAAMIELPEVGEKTAAGLAGIETTMRGAIVVNATTIVEIEVVAATGTEAMIDGTPEIDTRTVVTTGIGMSGGTIAEMSETGIERSSHVAEMPTNVETMVKRAGTT